MFQIEKRDGTSVPFDKEKIIKAINKAFLDVDKQLYETDTAEDIAEDIQNDIKDNPHLAKVEEIQKQSFVEDSKKGNKPKKKSIL